MKAATWLISARPYGTLSADIGALGLRLFIGLAMAFEHGLGKVPPSEGFVGAVGDMGFPAPGLFALGAGLSEFAGGLLLAVGFATRPAAFFACCTMAVAAFVRHADDPFATQEKALLYLAAFGFFLLAGAGRFSIDALASRRRAG